MFPRKEEGLECDFPPLPLSFHWQSVFIWLGGTLPPALMTRLSSTPPRSAHPYSGPAKSLPLGLFAIILIHLQNQSISTGLSTSPTSKLSGWTWACHDTSGLTIFSSPHDLKQRLQAGHLYGVLMGLPSGFCLSFCNFCLTLSWLSCAFAPIVGCRSLEISVGQP